MEERYPIIDVHCHVLPGTDDGSRSMEESMKLLEMAYGQGITSVIATSHDRGHNHLAEREELRQCLQERVQEKLPGFCIYPGSENYYHEELAQRLLEKRALSLAESLYVLVEFHPSASYGAIFRGVRSLMGSGFIPVLAHVERYGCLRDEEHFKELLGFGCQFQMNFSSLQGKWFSPEVRWCRKQVKDGNIFLMGTDMHRLDFRPPKIRDTLKWMNGHVEPSLVERMLWENPMEIVEGSGY